MKKKAMIYKYTPNNIELIDCRILRPKIVSPEEDPEVKLLQRDTDTLKIEKKYDLNYLTPSIVAIQLNVAKKSILESIKKYKKIKKYAIQRKDISESRKSKFIIDDSIELYDYIESAQAAIVFSFTALETFINLSIPEEYIFTQKDHKKTSTYNKLQIERWISWEIKLSEIIPEIYSFEGIKQKSFWSNVMKLVSLRNDIIHQKSFNDSSSIENIFNVNLPFICFSANEIIIFITQCAHKNTDSIPNNFEQFPVIELKDGVVLQGQTRKLEPIE